MRILHCITAYEPAVLYGGPTVVAKNQARGLVCRGHEVCVAASNLQQLDSWGTLPVGVFCAEGVETHYFHARCIYPHFSLVYSRSYRQWLQSEIKNYDLVHVHFGREWWPLTAAWLARRAEVPYVIQPHGMLWRRAIPHRLLDAMFTRSLIRSSAWALALQDSEADYLSKMGAPRVAVLPNGVIQAQHNLWGNRVKEVPTILFLGRLAPIKRATDLVEAARILNRLGIQFHLKFVGPDEGDADRIRHLLRKYHLEHRASLLGALPHAAAQQELASAAVFVSTSRTEPFGMSIIEALSAGVPTIVTEGCALAQELRAGHAALVAPVGADRLADAIRDILESPELARRLSVCGRQLVRQRYSMDAVLDQLEALYVKACGSTRTDH